MTRIQRRADVSQGLVRCSRRGWAAQNGNKYRVSEVEICFDVLTARVVVLIDTCRQNYIVLDSVRRYGSVGLP